MIRTLGRYTFTPKQYAQKCILLALGELRGQWKDRHYSEVDTSKFTIREIEEFERQLESLCDRIAKNICNAHSSWVTGEHINEINGRKIAIKIFPTENRFFATATDLITGASNTSHMRNSAYLAKKDALKFLRLEILKYEPDTNWEPAPLN